MDVSGVDYEFKSIAGVANLSGFHARHDIGVAHLDMGKGIRSQGFDNLGGGNDTPRFAVDLVGSGAHVLGTNAGDQGASLLSGDDVA